MYTKISNRTHNYGNYRIFKRNTIYIFNKILLLLLCPVPDI